MQAYVPSTTDKVKVPLHAKATSIALDFLEYPLLPPLILFLMSFCLFAMFSPQALVNGDAALYEQQILNLNLTQRTTHLGYYLIGIPFLHFLPLAPDYALNLMSCFYGALSVSCLFLIASRITQDRWVSLIAAVILLTSYPFAYHSAFAEVYVPQLFFFLFSIALFLYDKPVTAGLSFGLSFLISPSAIFGLTMLIPFRKNKKMLLRLIITALVLALAALFLHFPDYFSGGRGLLKASRADISIKEALLKEYRESISGMIWFIPFLIAGILRISLDKRLRDWGVAVMLLWLVTLTGAERFHDVPVQLPTYAFICIIGALGIQAALRRCRPKGPLIKGVLFIFLLCCVSGSAVLNFKRISQKGAQLTEYRDTVLHLQRIARPGFITLGSWTYGILFEHYLFRRSYTDTWINTEWLSGLWGPCKQKESSEKLLQAIQSGQEVWLLHADESLFAVLYKHGYVIAPFRNMYRATLYAP